MMSSEVPFYESRKLTYNGSRSVPLLGSWQKQAALLKAELVQGDVLQGTCRQSPPEYKSTVQATRHTRNQLQGVRGSITNSGIQPPRHLDFGIIWGAVITLALFFAAYRIICLEIKKGN